MREVASPLTKSLADVCRVLFVVSLLSVSAAGNGGYHGKVFLICWEDLSPEVSSRGTLPTKEKSWTIVAHTRHSAFITAREFLSSLDVLRFPPMTSCWSRNFSESKASRPPTPMKTHKYQRGVDSPITSKIERESTSVSRVRFFYHTISAWNVNVAFRLQNLHFTYKNRFSVTKEASRLQICSFQFTK